MIKLTKIPWRPIAWLSVVGGGFCLLHAQNSSQVSIPDQLNNLRATISNLQKQQSSTIDQLNSLKATVSNLGKQTEQQSNLQKRVESPSYLGSIYWDKKLAGGAAMIDNADSKRVAEIGSSSDQDGYIHLNRSDSKRYAVLEPTKLVLFGKNDKDLIYVGLSKNGSALIELDDSSSQKVVSLGVNSNGQGYFFLNGKTTINGAQFSDIAEEFDASGSITPGSVVSFIGSTGQVGMSTRTYDRSVAGVTSGAGNLQPGIELSADCGKWRVPVAIAGQVYVRVTGKHGAISTGDLLVSSEIPGLAMKAQDRTNLVGSVLGKAIGEFHPTDTNELGLIRMLVMTR